MRNINIDPFWIVEKSYRPCQSRPYRWVHVNVSTITNKFVVNVVCVNSGSGPSSFKQINKIFLEFSRIAVRYGEYLLSVFESYDYH